MPAFPRKLTYNFAVGSNSILQVILCVMLVAIALQSNAQVKLDFSHRRGFSEAPFNLTITSDNPSATIRYTLDGEEPTPTSGTIYDGSISVETTTVLRAIGYVAGEESKIYTHSYIFLDDVIRQPKNIDGWPNNCLLYTSPSPRDKRQSRMPSSA